MGSREITISNLRKACRTQCSDVKGRHIRTYIPEASYVRNTCSIIHAYILGALYVRKYLKHHTYLHTWCIVQRYAEMSATRLACVRMAPFGGPITMK